MTTEIKTNEHKNVPLQLIKNVFENLDKSHFEIRTKAYAVSSVRGGSSRKIRLVATLHLKDDAALPLVQELRSIGYIQGNHEVCETLDSECQRRVLNLLTRLMDGDGISTEKLKITLAVSTSAKVPRLKALNLDSYLSIPSVQKSIAKLTEKLNCMLAKGSSKYLNSLVESYAFRLKDLVNYVNTVAVHSYRHPSNLHEALDLDKNSPKNQEIRDLSSAMYILAARISAIKQEIVKEAVNKWYANHLSNDVNPATKELIIEGQEQAQKYYDEIGSSNRRMCFRLC